MLVSRSARNNEINSSVRMIFGRILCNIIVSSLNYADISIFVELKSFFKCEIFLNESIFLFIYCRIGLQSLTITIIYTGKKFMYVIIKLTLIIIFMPKFSSSWFVSLFLVYIIQYSYLFQKDFNKLCFGILMRIVIIT